MGSRPSQYPADAVRDVMDRIPHVWQSVEQMSAVERVVRIAIPPPRASDIGGVGAVLYDARVIDRRTYRHLRRYIVRAGRRFDAPRQATQFSYPLFFAVQRLYAEGRRHNDQELQAVRLIVEVARRTTDPLYFSGEMYYRHILSFRDTCTYFWNYFDEEILTGSCRFKIELLKFIEQFRDHPEFTETQRLKLGHTALILSGGLLLGGVPPRGPVRQKSTRQIGTEIQLSPAHLRSETRAIHVMSARAREEIVDDSGVTFEVEYPYKSTHCDRHRINRAVQTGFARTNVPTPADMNICCLNVHRNFLVHAERHVDQATFALIWAVAFLGLNHRRPIVERIPGYDYPRNDEILVCPKHNAVVYNIVRRRARRSESAFETCGRMFVPVGKRIAEGLLEIARSRTCQSSVEAVKRCAREFSKRSPGQNPTLARLRAGSSTHMKRLGLTDLECAALRGRVPPALLAISAYYPSTVEGIIDSFERAYRRAINDWDLPDAFRIEFGKPPPAYCESIYCGASRGIPLVSRLLQVIGAHYNKRARAIRDHRLFWKMERWIHALNAHEMGCYVMQEMGLGLRPVGKVADVSLAGIRRGALTFDKGSRQFSERSYSVLSRIHERMLSVRAVNRSIVESALSNIAVPVRFTEPDSDLALAFRYDAESRSVAGTRMRGKDFRTLEKDLSGILVGDEPANFLRHVSTEVLGSSVPRWQSDEHHGHKIVGRQAFGAWSTVSIDDLDLLERALETLHAGLVPKALLRPIASTETRV